MSLKSVLAAATVVMALRADAQSPAPDKQAAAHAVTPPALQYPLHHGFQVVKNFKAVSGLTGWVLKDPNGEYRLLYVTGDGRTLLAGALYNNNGEVISDAYSDEYLPKPDLTSSWTALEASSPITTGTATNPKSVIYVIMDPNCIYCHMLWKALKPYQAAGLQVRWLPVGFLHEDSEAKAAALIKGGSAAFEQAQQTFDEKTESGGIVGIQPTPEQHTQIAANMQIMTDAKIQGTPGIFYKDRSGKVLRKDGMPLMADLPAITGLPAQTETDPELKPFEN